MRLAKCTNCAKDDWVNIANYSVKGERFIEGELCAACFEKVLVAEANRGHSYRKVKIGDQDPMLDNVIRVLEESI